jgi:serine/threonine protein kinase
MLYCSNPTCSNPFSPDGNKFCLSCGSQTLSPLFRNRYRVIQLLGEGGFGRTYEAIDTDRMDDPCVIKQFFPQVQGTAALEKATELFKQEAKRLYELGEHPQIPRLIAYFEQDKRLYLVQELIEGQTLLAELQQQGAFSEEKILQLLADLLPVLKIVHEHGVIHRDIKPENIMRRRKDGKLMLIDFGVSKQVTATILGQAGTTVGTHGYAPMEQMRGQVYPASDLYSLGVTCIRLLTQCLPKEDAFDELYDGLNGRWIWRERLPQCTTITSQLEQVLEKLLKDYVKERYQSADEVLQALDSVTSKPSPSTARMPPPDNLISSVGVDYSKLRELLASKNWRGADKETAALILKVAGREKEGSVTVKNIEEFPCEDLRTIDQLWVKYSYGRFGFSVQKRIWQDAQQNLETFGRSVGWRNEGWFNSSWKSSYYALTFTLGAPKGHLPSEGVTVGRVWNTSLWLLFTLFSRIKTCGL